MYDMLYKWNEVSKKYKDEQITKEEYDTWRYNFPKPLVEKTMEQLKSTNMKKDNINK